jgi:membrane associated rhomboid family serine protease
MLDDRSYMREPEWRDSPRSGGAWSTVKILLVINIAVFLLLNIIIHYGTSAMGGFVEQFMILKSGAVKAGVEYQAGASLSSGQVLGIWDGAVWQLFTYQFMHFGLWHILCNMIGLYFIGKGIEEMYGGGVMLKLYLLGGVCGGLLETGMTWFGHSPDIGIVGASGSVFALIAALTWAMPDRRLTLLLFFVLPITLRARTIFWGLFGITAFCIVFPSRDGIAHGAHLGGFLLGWGFAHCVLLGGFSLGDWSALRRLGNKGSRHRKVVQVGAARAFSSNDNPIVDAEEEPPQEYMEQEIDPILEKIYKDGIHSLTDRERKILDEARKRMDG